MKGLGIGLCVVAVGCLADTPPPDYQHHQGTSAGERIHIENDDAVLAERVAYVSEDLELRVPKHDGELTVERVVKHAQIEPPWVYGHEPHQFLEEHADEPLPYVQTQAVTVDVYGDTAIVAYHYRGETYAGAIDVVDISDPMRPVLRSSAYFDHMDMNGATYRPGHVRGTHDDHGTGYVLAVASTCDPEFQPYTGMVERLRIDDHELTVLDDFRYLLMGQIGTSVTFDGDHLFATSGIAGSVVKLDAYDTTRLGETFLDDVRWADLDGDRVAVVEGGDDHGVLTILDADSMDIEARWPFPGATIPDSKSTVELRGAYAYVSAGPAGAMLLDTRTGAIVARHALPEDTGYDPADVVTNAVSVDAGLAFLADGGLGVTIARADDLRVIAQFDTLGSVNHLVYRDGYLYVAGGSEGFQVFRVSPKVAYWGKAKHEAKHTK